MDKRIVVLLGPTGVGKTAFSIGLAKQYGSPIISCDSRQIFKEMRIGVARPSEEELSEVQHHFIASHSIHEPYSAGKYELEAWDLVTELFKTHDTLLMVGGSMLYIDAFCNGIDEFPDHDPSLRAELNRRLTEDDGLVWMQAQLKVLDPETYNCIDLSNWKRVLRAVEVCLQTGKPYSEWRTGARKERPCVIEKIGLTRPREVLYERIDRRVDIMIADGLEDEARSLYSFRDLPALNTVGYTEWFQHFDGTIPRNEAIRLIKRNSRHYARKQLSYWGRDNSIVWKMLED